MFRKLYDWMLRMAGHRHAIRYMAAVSFAESSFFPIPPDAMVVPMILARREQAYWIAAVCTIASVLGGVLGYAIGYFLYDSVGLFLVNLYGAHDATSEFQLWYDRWGAAVILIKGFTPIPFKIVTIASGFFKYNFALFVLLAALTRGARFFLIAWLLTRWGAPMQAFIERRMNLVGWTLLALLAGGFAMVALI
ncbi:MAG TPA: YqaA family protein [Allosphingosinicella sp.]|nr:YqaA family protein [Allosphingosinicella sp.]